MTYKVSLVTNQVIEVTADDFEIETNTESVAFLKHVDEYDNRNVALFHLEDINNIIAVGAGQ